MRRSASLVLASAILGAGSGALAAEAIPAIGARPQWVVPPLVPTPDKVAGNAPFQFLMTSTQERILADGVEEYFEYAAVPLTTGGLQALGNISLPWNVERTELTLHKIEIRRGNSRINLLKPEELLVLRRENNLEKAMLDGMRTVVVPVWGLQVGDILSVAATYSSKRSTIAYKPEELQNFITPWPVARMERRFLIADGVKVGWKVSPSIDPARVTRLPGATEHRFVATDVKPASSPKFAPSRLATPLIQVTGYGEWSEVADLLRPLFDKARRPGPGSPLLHEADRMAAASSSPASRMLAALRLTQDQVRYVALLLGEAAYVPLSADSTWERRFGDCKAKTSLLLALLDRMGIEAEPMLVSTGNDDRLHEQLPSLMLFDHVMVRARLGAKTYYLDPVGYGQRTLDELTITPFSHGLPLRPQAALEALPQGELADPTQEVFLAWDGSRGLDGDVPFQAKLTLRGASAAAMRAKLSGATDMSEFDTGLKNLIPRVANDRLVIVEKNPESADGSFTISFSGEAPMDWSPFEGRRESRYTFSQNTLTWNANFDRSEGLGKDWPVFIGAAPRWERTTESIALPAGGKGYAVEATQLEKSVAGSRLSRSVTRAGDLVTMVAELRHLKREISAEEAREATPVLGEIAENYAYVVGPPARKRKVRSTR
jgi:hypothetical protein